MEIGGYFELELRKGEHYHKNAIKLNTARNCFEYILKVRKYSKVYIPYYTCKVMLEPIKKCNVEYEFYHINELLEPKQLVLLQNNEAFLYSNYFGLKQNAVKNLFQIYGRQLIVDNAQAFYAEPIGSVDTFYSARKFFGVADGAYLYIDEVLKNEPVRDYSSDKMAHLLKRIDRGAESGYNDFQANENLLDDQPIKKMSSLTEKILQSIDYLEIREKRKDNYLYLENLLNDENLLHLKVTPDDVPMVFPFLVNQSKNLKQKLIKRKIFVATYWNNVLDWCHETEIEYQLASNTVFLPVDQRYGVNEMVKMAELIKNESYN
jgi:hypothetical protein